jgi:ribosomal protein S18 acetylase RimI-like enzyme
VSSLLQQERLPAAADIVDLAAVGPAQIERLLAEESRVWLDKLYWDTSVSGSQVRRAVGERALAGKAVRVDGRVVAFGYYFTEETRTLVGGVLVSREPAEQGLGPPLVSALLEAAQSDPPVWRVESQFISFELAWLSGAFRARGFQEHERWFMRRSLAGLPLDSLASSPRPFFIETWSADDLNTAAATLERAHALRVDGEINELYRSREGCRSLLHSIALGRGCGPLVGSASFVARHPSTRIPCGLILTSEISSGHAHLAQIAVSPEFQSRGVGTELIRLSLETLAGEGFQTASLLVSRANHRALSLYRTLGFEPVHRFPVFAWDRARAGRGR